jgi:NAD(P)-dependent dehydrogenase (short-subunit alcohol dehydrogenase family)
MNRTARDHGLRVLISGAAEGVGLACAHAFAERGAELILTDSDGAGLTRATDSLGGFSRFCDVVSEASVTVFAAEIAAKFGHIDVLINGAGRAYVRTLGMMLMSRALMPLLRRGDGRRLIVNIAPAGGFVRATSIFPYAGSREGFDGLSDALAEQTRGSQISVVSVTPRLRRADGEGPGVPGAFYRFEEVDVDATAAAILDRVAASRPEWRQRPIRRERRA